MSRAIDNFSGEYRFLSNFYLSRVRVEVDGRLITGPSVEHVYQALKALKVEDRLRVLNAGSPANAKQRGKEVELRPDWEERKLEFMELLVAAKFRQNAKLAEKLLATGDAELVEGNWWGDRFWGVCHGEGENHLGKILMQVREELRAERREVDEDESAEEELTATTEVDTPPSSSADSVPQFTGPWAKLDRWIGETAVFSSPWQMIKHQDFRDVMLLPNVSEEVIGRMENGDARWQYFILLARLTNFDPVPEDERGAVEKMRLRWIRWFRGREKPEYWSALAEEGIYPQDSGVVRREEESAAAAYQPANGEEALQPEEHSGETD